MENFGLEVAQMNPPESTGICCSRVLKARVFYYFGWRHGVQVAAGSTDNDIRVWDIATGEHLVLLKGHTAAVTCLDFSAVRE